MTRQEQIVFLYRQGKGQREISRLLHINQPAVRKWLVKLHLLHPKPCQESPPSPSGELVDSIPRAAATPAIEEVQKPARAVGPLRFDLTYQIPLAFRLSVQGTAPTLRPHEQAEGTSENQPQRALPSRGVVCGWCRGWFAPRYHGHYYCCNACGLRARRIPVSV